jgi:ribosomal protein S18 acetylase RimI-like enzyme
MTGLRIVVAESEDLRRYLDLLEDVADWLESRGIDQWRPGSFRRSVDFYAGSIARKEVHFAFLGDRLVGTLRVLLREPIVWPEILVDDGVYVFSLAVKRRWAGQGLGRRMLDWAAQHAAARDRRYVRLDCLADNEFLSQYYAKAGFVERGEIDARFPDPIGMLRLRRFEKEAHGAATFQQNP